MFVINLKKLKADLIFFKVCVINTGIFNQQFGI